MIDFEYENLYKESSVPKDYIIQVYKGSTLQTVLTDESLYSEEFELYRPLCTEKTLRYGCCESAYVKFKVLSSVIKLKNKKLIIYQTLGTHTNDPVKVGEFYVYKDELSDDRQSREVIAYDKLYQIIKADVSDWYGELSLPMTLRNFRNAFFNYFELTQESASLCNDSIVIPETVLADTLTGLDVLEAICGGNGCLGCINNEGNFKYVILSEADTKEYEYYKQGTFVYEDYDVEQATKLTLYSIRKGKNISVTVGSGSNRYIIMDNFLFYEKTKEQLSVIANNILNVIKETPIFRPLKVETYGDMCVEAGDYVTFTNNDGTTYGTFVFLKTTKGLQALSDTFETKGTEEFEYDLNSESSNIRRLWNNTKVLLDETNGARTYVYAQRNNTAYNPITSSDWTTIIRIPFATVDETIPVFLATIPLIMSADGEVHFTYFIDDVQVEGDEDIIYLTAGRQIVTISTFFECEKDRQYTFKVKAKAGYRESENRKQDAKILSLKDWIDNQSISISGNTAHFNYNYVEQPVDNTPPTIEIEQFKIRAMIFASGLASEAPWDGNVIIVENSADFDMLMAEFEDVSEALTVGTLIPTRITLADTVTDFLALVPDMENVQETLNITLHQDSVQRLDENDEPRLTEDGTTRYTEGE